MSQRAQLILIFLRGVFFTLQWAYCFCFHGKVKQKTWAGDAVKLAEDLPSMHKALCLIAKLHVYN